MPPGEKPGTREPSLVHDMASNVGAAQEVAIACGPAGQF
eukprot:CAMPEP_0197662216 /NCGR_PEP_ID=MMETSP1338-20131121/52489_1 /TAXON_ID=43686 ORGANISM="Pelagodinium beii, Strain RCC1491" /NCGR_SAMPLE_ID=MMETSP1338 /ASSEMBLY_ACC=CAM_ASM_000754 /LENGTH=38 /DNA_ID= /DNA_START= /DNA_END= /DNA_ORIENTATION=